MYSERQLDCKDIATRLRKRSIRVKGHHDELLSAPSGISSASASISIPVSDIS